MHILQTVVDCVIERCRGPLVWCNVIIHYKPGSHVSCRGRIFAIYRWPPLVQTSINIICKRRLTAHVSLTLGCCWWRWWWCRPIVKIINSQLGTSNDQSRLRLWNYYIVGIHVVFPLSGGHGRITWTIYRSRRLHFRTITFYSACV